MCAVVYWIKKQTYTKQVNKMASKCQVHTLQLSLN